MKRISLIQGGAFGALTALGVVGLTYLAERLAGLPFAPFDIFDWMTRVLPGGVITFVIAAMVSVISALHLGQTSVVAKLTEQAIAITQFVAAGAIFGIILAALARRRPGLLRPLAWAGGLLFLAVTLIAEITIGFPGVGVLATVVWLALVYLIWASILARVAAPQPAAAGAPAGEAQAAQAESGLSRRQFLWLVGAGSFTVAVSALGLDVFSTGGGFQAEEGGPGPAIPNTGQTAGPAASPSQAKLAARFKPVPGTRPEVTSTGKFYRIDINTLPPEVDGNTWKLPITGLVDNPLTLTLDEIRSRPAASQYITLSCISNEIGGDLISTALFTGVPFKEVLKEAGLRLEAKAVAIEAVDGFYESVPLEEAMDERTMLVYAMNGEPLPAAHGYPLRIYIPNVYGMKQPKWITRMEVIDHDGPGYWVDRGWSAKAIVKTTSVIDTVDTQDQDPNTGLIPVGGIAYAGARGTSKVEVQVDDGPWQAAELRNPALSPLTWVQWRYLWKSSPARHTFRVRAYDGDGHLQQLRSTPPHPDGATGMDEYTANVRNE